MRIRRASDDVGVHAGARDVLAHLLDDQHVDGRERQPRHPLARALEQPPLARLEVRGVEGLDEGGLVVAVLDDAEAEADARPGQHLATDGGDDRLVAVLDVGPVVLDRAFVLAEPDRHHLEEAGLDRALEVGVRLHAVDQADPVGLGRVAVEPHGQAQRLAHLHDVHGGAHRAAHGRLGDAIVLQDRELPLGGPAPVAAHGGEDERPGAQVLEVADGGADDRVDVGDPPAARAHGDRVAALDGHAGGGQGLGHGAGNVGHPGARERLADAEHLRQHGADYAICMGQFSCGCSSSRRRALSS